MAVLNSNGVYLAIDSTDISALWTTDEMEATVEEVEITHGSGQTHKQYAAGLAEKSGKFTLVYDTVEIQSTLALIQPGVHTMIYGPEGSTAGKPKYAGSVIITSVSGPKVDVQKNEVVFAITWKGADTPTTNLYDGGVF